MSSPYKLTDTIRVALTRHVRAGSPYHNAAGLCGVPVRTLNYWLSKGREGVEPYAAFYADMERARMECQQDCIRTVITKASDDVSSAQWWLERTQPDVFGKTQTVRVEVEREVVSLLDMLQPHMSREAYVEMVHAVAVVSGLGVEEPGEPVEADTATQ